MRAWTHRGLAAVLLWPVSLLYGLAVAIRHWQFRRGHHDSSRLPACIIVVGNVVAGGAGKTPVVIALVRHLQAQQFTVGVVSRGFGRSTHDCREVLDDAIAQESGDEPALIRRSTGVPVFVAVKRAEAARALLVKYPQTQVIICDDGLQHLALARDVEICVFDDRGVGNGFLLPAGPLREPWPREQSVLPANRQLVLHTGAKPAFNEGFTARRALANHALQSDGTLVPLEALRNRPLVGLAAIAQPEQFFGMLRAKGLTLTQTLALPDHYNFDSWLCPFPMGQQLICTEKDAIKLWRTHPEILAVPLVVTLAPDFTAAIDEAVTKLSSTHGHTTA